MFHLVLHTPANWSTSSQGNRKPVAAGTFLEKVKSSGWVGVGRAWLQELIVHKGSFDSGTEQVSMQGRDSRGSPTLS